MELSGLLHDAFQDLFREGERYRSTGIILLDLTLDTQTQYSLFEDPIKAEKVKTLYAVIDEISKRYGKHTLHLGALHMIETEGSGKRGEPTAREQPRLAGETKRKHLSQPILDTKV
jgi:hypothetical protein